MFLDPSSSPKIRSSSLRMMTDDDIFSGQFTSGLLDIHSFDTELLSEVSILIRIACVNLLKFFLSVWMARGDIYASFIVCLCVLIRDILH